MAKRKLSIFIDRRQLSGMATKQCGDSGVILTSAYRSTVFLTRTIVINGVRTTSYSDSASHIFILSVITVQIPNSTWYLPRRHYLVRATHVKTLRLPGAAVKIDSYVKVCPTPTFLIPLL